MSKTKMTKAEAEALGIDLDNINPNGLPENISPVIKADLIERWKSQQEKAGEKVGAADLPDATYRQNERVREREAAKAEDTGNRQSDAVNK